MSEFDIKIPGGESRRLLTAGKYCDRDILVTAEGGSGLPDGDMSDPEYVYAVTRPRDWLPMPVPGDDEVYMLGLIPEGMSDWFGGIITFTGSCVVEFGRLVDGFFVAQDSLTPTSGTLFSKQLFAADYGDITEDGNKQYIARIKAAKATKIDLCVCSQIPGNTNVVDIACGIPLTRGFRVGNYNAPRDGLLVLNYLRFLGNGTPGDVSGGSFAGGCYNLKAITHQGKMGSSVYGSYALYDAHSLIAVSGSLFDRVDYISYAFVRTNLYGIKVSCKTKSLAQAFMDSEIKMFSGNDVDTSLCTNFSQSFYGCRSLRSILELNIAAATNVDDAFAYCFVSRLTFAGDTTPGGWTIKLSQTLLSHDALVEMIASLPTATAAATITITGNPGAAELTDAEIAVATAKNWTVTI